MRYREVSSLSRCSGTDAVASMLRLERRVAKQRAIQARSLQWRMRDPLQRRSCDRSPAAGPWRKCKQYPTGMASCASVNGFPATLSTIPAIFSLDTQFVTAMNAVDWRVEFCVIYQHLLSCSTFPVILGLKAKGNKPSPSFEQMIHALEGNSVLS